MHKHDIDFKKAFTVEKEENSQVKISGEIPYEELKKERAGAVKKLGQDIKIDGFRPGNIPENILVEKVGEMAILNEMAERALSHFYPHIVEAHDLEVIGYPQIQITKIAPENPLAFTATVAVLPEIKLPDYKKLASEVNKSKESEEVTAEDIEKQIKDIMRQRVAFERLQKKAADDSKAEESDLPTPESEVAKSAPEDPANIKDEDLPELNDEYVKGLGQPGQFENVDDFKTKVKEHLEIEKKQAVVQNHRAKLTDTIVDLAEMELPSVLIDSELNQMTLQMEEDIKRAGMNFDEYLTHIKKTKEEMLKEWRPAAEKRAKLQLVLNEIAKAENIKPDDDALNTQVNQLLEQYKEADEMRVRVYVASVLQNEAVIKMLEEA
ncbi:hypothetical protein CL653_00580 [bacterium]|nr:hypothetical protein [bacterium]|tara:strand:+ start:372 stop:1511 length:1140 start_codon:yes stop_codon:yes gene_type:complete